MKRYSLPIVFYARLDVEAPDEISAEKALQTLFTKEYHGVGEDGALIPGSGDMNVFRFEDYEQLAVEER